MSSYYWLGLVGAAAAIAQGWMLFKTKSHTTLSSAFTILSLILILQHSLEFVISLLLVSNPDSIVPAMHVFMATLYFMALAMMNMAKTIVGSKLADFAFNVLAVMTAGIMLMHANGMLFQSFTLTEYSVISTPSEYQGIWFMYASILLTSIAGVLVSGVYDDNKEVNRRSWVAIKALSPIIICSMSVVILRQFGINASTAIALPFASSIMLAILMLEEKNEFLVFEENLKDRWARTVIKLRVGFYVLFNWHGTDRKELLKTIDTILITGAMKRKSTASDAAEFLNIPRNTLNNLRQKNVGS